MRPGRLTLSGGSCVAQIIYPSATAPRPTGEPESRLSVYGTGTSMRMAEKADGPAQTHTHTYRNRHKCHTHSFTNSVHAPWTFLSLYAGYKQPGGLFSSMSFCASFYIYAGQKGKYLHMIMLLRDCRIFIRSLFNCTCQKRPRLWPF